jgi:DNA-binding response OmpR family regulator
MARILVIEDDTSLAFAIQMVIQNDGLDVVVANSGRCGIDVVETTDIDVVIVDMLMPGMDGFDTIRALRTCAPNVPIIAMSGHSLKSTNDVLATATRLGAALGLRKPFRPKDLMTAVVACLDEGARASAGAPAATFP